ncbi:MAG: hypothetical protein ACK5PP_00520 [Acidimicrobiales bacterium]
MTDARAATRTIARPGDATPDVGDELRRWPATGIDGVWLPCRVTADGVVVVSPRDRIGSRWRSRRLETVDLADLPDGVPDLASTLAELVPRRAEVVVACGGPDVAAVVDTVRGVVPEAEERIWLIGPDLNQLIEWAPRCGLRLISRAASIRGLDERAEPRAARLRSTGIRGLALPHREWGGGLVALAHRFELAAVALDPVHEREMAAVIGAGVDLVVSDQPDRLQAVAVEFGLPSGRTDG